MKLQLQTISYWFLGCVVILSCVYFVRRQYNKDKKEGFSFTVTDDTLKSALIYLYTILLFSWAPLIILLFILFIKSSIKGDLFSILGDPNISSSVITIIGPTCFIAFMLFVLINNK